MRTIAELMFKEEAAFRTNVRIAVDRRFAEKGRPHPKRVRNQAFVWWRVRSLTALTLSEGDPQLPAAGGGVPAPFTSS
jgi:hypothetical protein